MDRRHFLLASLAAAFAAPIPCQGQPRMPTVGVLSPTTRDNPIIKAFEQALAEQGYTASKTVRLEARHTDGRGDRLLDFAAELASRNVDVVVAWSSAGAQAAQRATGTIPIVFVSVTAPEKIGLVQSVVRPSGNITGVAFTSTEATYSKTLEILKEAVSTAGRVAVLIRQLTLSRCRLSTSRIRGLKITVEPHTAAEPEHLDRAFTAITRSNADAMYVAPSGLVYQYRRRIIDFAARSRLPTIYPFGEAARTAVSYPSARARPPWHTASRQLCRPNPPRREARRIASRTADAVRTPHQPQDRQGPRPHDPAVGSAARGSGHPVAHDRSS